MSEDRASLSTRAYRHLLNHGLRSLVRITGRQLSKEFISRQTVSVRDLDRRAVESIWFTEPEGWICLEQPAHPELRDAFDAYPRRFYLDSEYICELDGCHLIGTKNAVGLHSGQFVLQETTGHRLDRRFQGGSYLDVVEHILKSTAGLKPPRRNDALFPLICPDPSYYHWMMEYLPKLRLLELYQRRTGDMPRILIESNPRPFVRQTLALAGYDSSQWIEWDHQPCRARNVIVASHRPHTFTHDNPPESGYRPSPAAFQWVRERFRSAVASTADDTKRRIYVTRQQAERERKVLNYDEVLAELHRRGFEAHALETISVEEQVKLFRNAAVIMGPHGAGLLNMLFANDPHVIELFPRTTLKPHFQFLSSILSVEYDAIITQGQGNNLVVDMDHFRNRLDELGLTPQSGTSM